MVVCKFYQQGNCRFGDKCRNEHPGAGRPGDSGSTNPSENRFGIFGRGTSSNEGRGTSTPYASTPYGIKTTDIRDDLTAGKGRPQWILSTYGPGKNPPASLLEGSEFSFEELRLRFYELASQGNQQLANDEANGLWAKSEVAMQEIVNKVDNVAKFLEEAERKHPNRYDFCKIDGTKSLDQVKLELQNGAAGGYGPSSSSGAVANPFTQPASAPSFGQPSGFGQPSAVGSTPAFGKPTQPGTFGQPAFGQPSAPSQAPAFGNPSHLQPAPAFGQPSQPSGFGQPSKPPGFGQPAFGQPSQPSQPIGFGQPSKPPGFGQPAFGQPSAPGNTFGQPSFGAAGSGQSAPVFRQSTPAGGVFGQPSQPQDTPAPANPFSRPPVEKFNPFGTSSQPGPSITTPNNQASTAGDRFGQPPAPASGLSPTNGPAPKTATGAIHPLTGQPSAAIIYTQTLPNIPTTTRQVTDQVTKRPKTILVTYKGCKVEYKDDKPCYQRPDGKGLERIFFPEGEPVVRKQDVEPDESKYTDEVTDAYKHLYANGGFDPSKPMPSVPPKMEWDAFDF